MTIMGSVDISFTNSTKIAKGAEQTATTAQETANGAAQTAGQAQATAETASQTAVQAAATAADAAQAAQIAITTANGKNKAYYGATTPTSPQSGDIWFVTDANGEVTAIRHWDGTQWVDDVDNVAVQEAIDEANQTAANAQQVGEQAQQTAEQATQVAQSAQADADDAKAQVQSAVDTANQAAEDAQTAINQAQTAFDNAQDALSTANSAVDTANNASQTASNAATQSSNAWTKAQDAMAEAQKKADASSVYTKTEIDDALEGYATTTTVNTLTGRVDSAETAIQQNTNAIQLKADKSTVDTLTGRVSTAEATLTAQADQIAARITKTDADAKYATQTALTATANSLTSNISAVQTNLDNLQVGGRNLFLNSDFSNGYSNWKPNENATLSVLDSADYGHVLKVVTTGTSAASGVTQNVGSKITYGEEYTVSLLMKADEETTVKIQNSNTSWLSCDVTTEWKLFTVTIKPTNSNTIGFFNSSASTFYMAYVKIEKGNKATDWSPAPEDMVTAVQFNTLSQTLDSTVSRIGNAEGNISALQQTSDSFATRISNAEGNISSLTQTTNGLQTTVSGKVDKTTYNSFVTQTNTALQSKLSVQDAASTYATQSSLTQTANSLTSQITSVQTNLNNLQIGGRNLVPNSTGLLLNPDGKTAQSWQEGTISHANNDGTNSLEVQNSGTSESTRSGTVFNVEPNTTYVFRVRIKGSTNSTTMDVYFLGSKTAKTGIGGSYDYVHTLATGTTNKNDWQEYITKFTTNSDEICGYIRIDNNASSNGNISSVYFSQIKVEKGTKATDWSPAPEDMATQSQITQLANDINLRVKQNDVINQINISTEGILIDGKKVHITGQTTIDNAVIKDAMIQSMTANKLTAGTIDANVITVKNINASNIVTGTLDASKATVTNIDASKITTGTLNAARIAAGSIDASKLNVSTLSALSANLGSVTAGNISGVNINIGNGNFTVDTAGNLVAKNANITGAINATSGTFSGSVNVISTVTNPWGNYDTVKINPTYRFPIHIDDDESRHTYLSSGIIEIYYPAFSDINAPSAKTTIEPNLITFSENDSVVSQITANAIYSIDYYNGQSTISSNGNAQFGNISFNGAHSIISKDGGQLYFTNSGGSRVDISASNGNFDQRVNPNNMRIGYHTFEVSDGSALYFTDSSGNYSYSPKAKSWATSSKFEWKQDFQAIEPQDMLEIIKKANVVQFKYKADVQAGRDDLYTGFVIGGGYQTPDEFLNYDRDGIDTYKVTGVLTGAVQELSARDESNKERLSIIEEQNKNLLLKIADLEARLAKLEA